MTKKGTWDKIMEKLKEAYDTMENNEEEDIEEDMEEDDSEIHTESFITRMTLAYNNLVEACESMPTSYSKEFKYKKDKDRARVLYNRCIDIAEQYHNFLNRMKEKVT